MILRARGACAVYGVLGIRVLRVLREQSPVSLRHYFECESDPVSPYGVRLSPYGVRLSPCGLAR